MVALRGQDAVVLAAALVVMALVMYMLLYHDPTTIREGGEPGSAWHGKECAAPMYISDDERLVVFVAPRGEGKPKRFMVDTAFEMNVLTTETALALGNDKDGDGEVDETGAPPVTIVTAGSFTAKSTRLPEGLFLTDMGGKHKCALPSSDRTVVADQSVPEGFDGILGLAFMHSAQLPGGLLLDIPGKQMVLNPSAARFRGRTEYERSSGRDPMYPGLYLIHVVVDNEGSMPLALVVDTGTRNIIVDQSWAAAYRPRWRHEGNEGSIDMSGHHCATRKAKRAVAIGRHSMETAVSTIVSGGRPGSIVNREGTSPSSPAGLIGVAALRDYALFIDNKEKVLRLM
jgi:hypothetical protein